MVLDDREAKVITPRGLSRWAMLLLPMAARIAVAQQLPTIVCAVPPGPPRSFWDYWSLMATPVGSVVTLIVGFYTINRTIRNWKWDYFTKEWSTLLQFVMPHSRFMDCALTANYKAQFTGNEAIQYEMIARLCIGYLDDLYFIGSKREIENWLTGSFRLLAGTHRAWLEDHKDAYDRGFYKYVMTRLNP